MKYHTPIASVALVLAATLSAPAMADEGKPTPAVMTDTAPLPAQDRASHGAIILEDSMVIAQREAFMQAGNRTGLSTIGRNALRATIREMNKSELADARASEAARLRDRGASGLEEK